MTTTRERALEAALRSLEDQSGRLRSLCVAAGVLKPSDIGHAQALENESAARAALALPPDQPAAPAPVAVPAAESSRWSFQMVADCGYLTRPRADRTAKYSGDCLAVTGAWAQGYNSISPKEAAELGRLIAAAPDMLAALQNLIRPLKNGWKVSDMAERIADAESAIARATGREG